MEELDGGDAQNADRHQRFDETLLPSHLVSKKGFRHCTVISIIVVKYNVQHNNVTLHAVTLISENKIPPYYYG